MRCSCQSQLLICLAACGDSYGKACLNSGKNTFDYHDASSSENLDHLLRIYFSFEVNALSFLIIKGRVIKLEIRGFRFSIFVNTLFWK